jgi:hypothetical protein
MRSVSIRFFVGPTFSCPFSFPHPRKLAIWKDSFAQLMDVVTKKRASQGAIKLQIWISFQKHTQY